MTTYGVNSTGFLIKPLETILDEIAESQRDAISPSLDTETESPVGQLNGTFASPARELWELIEAAYSAGSILTATGFALDQKAAGLGITRNAASFSTATLRLTLDNGVTVPAGSRVSVAGNASVVFETLSEVTNATGAAALITVLSQCTVAGSNRANANTLTNIVDAVSGWNAVTNLTDATLGGPIETDAALRQRSLTAASGRGIGTVAAIRNKVQAVASVQAVLVFENTSDLEVGGQPPHSVEVVIYDGSIADDDAVAQAIWDSKAGGIATYGVDSGTAVDGLGENQILYFSHVAEIDYYLEADIVVTGGYPASGDTGLRNAIADWADANLVIGADVIISAFTQPIFDYGGVFDVKEIRAGRTASPTSTVNDPVSPREIATFDTSRIVITRVV